MSAEFSVRRFESTDLTTLQRLVSEMQDFEREIDPRLRPGDVMTADYTAAMMERCATQNGVVLLAVAGSDIVGFVAVVASVPSEGLDQPPEGHALVTDLAVTTSFRRRGVGRGLLDSAEEYARSCGARELRIAVLQGNRPAARLYESTGFVPYLVVLAKDLG